MTTIKAIQKRIRKCGRRNGRRRRRRRRFLLLFVCDLVVGTILVPVLAIPAIVVVIFLSGMKTR
jgi:hypothetical protein